MPYLLWQLKLDTFCPVKKVSLSLFVFKPLFHYYKYGVLYLLLRQNDVTTITHEA